MRSIELQRRQETGWERRRCIDFISRLRRGSASSWSKWIRDHRVAGVELHENEDRRKEKEERTRNMLREAKTEAGWHDAVLGK